MAEDYNSIGFKNADIDKLKSVMSKFKNDGSKASGGEDPKKTEPKKEKLVDTKTVTRDSINNGKVVGKITETMKTYKGDSETTKKQPVVKAPIKKEVVTNVNKNVPNTPKKSVTPEKNVRVVKTSNFTPVKENVTPIKTKSVGIVANKPEIKAPTDASKLTARGDNRTWQQKKKEEVFKKDYVKWRQGDETMSEWKARSIESSKKIAEKNRSHEKGGLGGSLGSGGGGCGCH